MLSDVKTNLQELGLSPKEIDVYVSMLELGPSSVQDIAKKAGVNRTTTYVMMEKLKGRGLTSCYEKGKKILFCAETPERLMQLILGEQSRVDAKRDRLQLTLPRLLAIFNSVEEKPRVRFFDGTDAIAKIHREIAESRDALWEFFSVDEALGELAKIGGEERVKLTRRMEGRVIMAIKPGCVPPYFDTQGVEARCVDFKTFPFTGDIGIVGDRVYALSMKTIGIGIIIESGEIAEILRALFAIAWQTAKPWTPPAGWEL
jgi:sugar-specific transcriptional regulator TrmB